MELLLIAVVVIAVGTLTTPLWRPAQSAPPAVRVPTLSGRWDAKRAQLHSLLLAWGLRMDRHGVGAWLHNLPESDLRKLTGDLATYCADMGFDVLWVVDGQIEDDALREQVDQVLFRYLQSFYLAAGVQTDLRLYKVMVAFLNNLDGRRNRVKAEALYRRLSADGVIAAADAQLLFENAGKRRQHIATVLRATANAHPVAFKAAAAAILLD